MANRFPFNQIPDFVEGNFNRLIREAVLTADAQLKDGSPVDTGRLRASWQITQNAADGKGVGPGDYRNFDPPPNRTNYSQERIGNVYNVYNNLEYAEPVISGKNLPPSWQKAKPAGWRSKDDQVTQNYHLTVAKNVQNYIRDNAGDL